MTRRVKSLARISRRRFLGSAGLVAAAPWISGCAARESADWVLFNGEVHTADANLRVAQALAVRGGRIVGVGSSEDMLRLAGPATRRLDLDGRSLLPGINDSHLHLLGWGLSQPPFSLDVTYPTVTSIADVAAAVGRAAAEKSPGEWITGRGWDQPYLSEGRAPTAADLDAVAPDHPVALTEFSGHAVWANSLALKIAGIGPQTEPPPGGVIVRDGAGQPTGLLFEGAGWMLTAKIPEASAQQKEAAIRHAMQQMLRRGITSATDPRIDPAEIEVYLRIAADAEQPRLRMNALLGAGPSRQTLVEALEGFGELQFPEPRWMQVSGVKIMGDGIPTGNKTAWLNEPYEGGGNGSLLVDGDSDEEKVAELNAMIRIIHAAGLQAGIHMTGSRAIDEVVEAYARVQSESPRADARHYVIHADLASEATLSRMADLGVGANFNPEIKHLIADGQVESLGPERAAYEWPYRSALDAGVVVASSSDAPVTAGNWLQGIATCVERTGKQSGRVSGPEQRITLAEAIRSYTWAGAWQDHADDFKGTLAAGKTADLCVLDGRLSDTPPGDYAGIETLLTMVDGQVVHGDEWS